MTIDLDRDARQQQGIEGGALIAVVEFSPVGNDTHIHAALFRRDERLHHRRVRQPVGRDIDRVPGPFIERDQAVGRLVFGSIEHLGSSRDDRAAVLQPDG